MKYQQKYKPWLIPFILVFCSYVTAQPAADSLDFNTVLSRVIKNNPAIQQMDVRTGTSGLKEKMVKTAYLPNVYTAATANRTFPIPAFDITLPNPETGDMISRHLQMYPDIGMDFSLKLNQLVYDFGKTGNNLSLQQTYTDISRISAEQLKQRLSLLTAGYFYNLMFVQQAVKIKMDQKKALDEHLKIIEKKQLTGSATQYEILSTRVRISSTETQLTDLQTTKEVLISHLNDLMAKPDSSFAVKGAVHVSESALFGDTLVNYAFDHRTEINLAEKNRSVAQWNYEIARSSANPSLSFFGSTGYKNGYISQINQLKFNYVAGLSLNIPLFDANRKNISKQIAGSAVTDAKLETENVQNRIADEVRESYVSLELSRKKIDQFRDQLALAERAFEQANINYQVGTITNLDLLDSSNALAESRLSLLRAETDYKLNEIKFKSALGEQLY